MSKEGNKLGILVDNWTIYKHEFHISCQSESREIDVHIKFD